MRLGGKEGVFVAATLLLLAAAPAFAETASKYDRYIDRAGKSFERADYKGAESSWKRALAEADLSQEDTEKNNRSELCLKRLGECCLKASKYIEADDYFKRAQEVAKRANIEDAELAKDSVELTGLFKQVTVPEFADFLTTAFKELMPEADPEKAPNFLTALQEAGVEHVSLIRTPEGATRVEVVLGNRFIKEIGNKDVSHVGLDKTITFNVVQPESGGVTIANIKGFHVRAKIWVNIIGSDIVEDPEKGPVALVTGEKFGVSQKVTCKLPKNSVSPFMAFVKKVTTFGGVPDTMVATDANGGVPATTGTATGTAAATTATTGTTMPGSTDTTSGAIVPVSNPVATPDGTVPETVTASPQAD